MTNEEIIEHLKANIIDFVEEKQDLDINDPFGDYIEGLISASQGVLLMMGVPDEEIPNDGSC
jgi:hypothetical protein